MIKNTPIQELDKFIKVIERFIKGLDEQHDRGVVEDERYKSLMNDANNKIKEFEDAVNILNEAIVSEDVVCGFNGSSICNHIGENNKCKWNVNCGWQTQRSAINS